MSLINDALKRTQQTARAQMPPPLDDLELRPIDPQHSAPHAGGSRVKTILWILALLVIVANIGLWLLFQNRGKLVKLQAAARAVESQPAAPLVTETEPKSVALPEKAEPTPAAHPAPVVPSAESTPKAGTLEQPVLETAPVIAVERPELKLRTILSHPTRPSAMINNRILFVGDRVEGYAVAAIGQNDVTLTLGEDTWVLSLP